MRLSGLREKGLVVIFVGLLVGTTLSVIGEASYASFTETKVSRSFNDSPRNKFEWNHLDSYRPETYSGVEWDRVIGGNLPGNGYSVCETSDGTIVVTGTIETTTKKNDIALIKLDLNGNIVWNTSFGGTDDDIGYCVRQTSDGGYVIAGAVDVHFAQMYFSDHGLAKVDRNSTLLWMKSHHFNRESWGRAMLETSDHGFLIVGFTSSNWLDVLVLKTDELGNEQWHAMFGGPKIDYGWAVERGTDGGYLILGHKEPYSNDTVWLIKIDEEGHELWNRTVPGTKNVWASSMVRSFDGGYVITGSQYRPPSTDAWMLKVNALGDEYWNRTYGGPLDEYGDVVQQTDDGGYVVSGFIEASGYYYTLWIVRTDTYGKEQWNRSFSGKYISGSSDIKQTTDGAFIITGTFDFNIWVLKIADEPPQAKRRAFVIGTIIALETEGVFTTFQAHNLWYFQRFPLQIHHYSGNDYVTISQNFTGMLRPRFVCCLSRG